VALSPAGWLIDKSAVHRLRNAAVAERLLPLVSAGLVGVSIATELEMGYSARSTADYWETRALLLDRLLPVALPYRAEARAREVQATLVEQGLHRSAGVADLLIAATAEMEGLTVLHYHADFDVIAGVTGQPTEWIVPRGTVP